jgi:hypothetical protein
MAIVDDQGRLFGRFNVVDAVVAVFVLGLIPLLYGAAVLFRVPPPQLTAVEPNTLQAGSSGRVTIKGENLRPYMRVSFGTTQGKNFLFKAITEADVDLGELPPGVYDVVLYDVAQEQSRLPKAFTVLPAPLPPTRVMLVGVFANLDAERAKLIKPGDVIAGVGTVREIGEPMPAQLRVSSSVLTVQIPVENAVMLPAVVESICEMRPQTGIPFCVANDTSLQPTVVLMGQHAAGRLPFQIDQLRGGTTLESVEIDVRFTAPRSVMSTVRVGDVDRGPYPNPLAADAVVLNVRSQVLNPDLMQADVTLRVKAERGSDGWVYASVPLRAGADLAMRTARYQLNGPVLAIRPEWTAPK